MELGRYFLIFDINRRILKYISIYTLSDLGDLTEPRSGEVNILPLFTSISKNNLLISYLQNKEQSSLVIQSLVMSIDLHRSGKTSFYTNRIKMLNYYNIPFNLNHDNLNDTEILHFVDHIQKKYITHWKHYLCNSQMLEFYDFKDSYRPSIYLDVTKSTFLD